MVLAGYSLPRWYSQGTPSMVLAGYSLPRWYSRVLTRWHSQGTPSLEGTRRVLTPSVALAGYSLPRWHSQGTPSLDGTRGVLEGYSSTHAPRRSAGPRHVEQRRALPRTLVSTPLPYGLRTPSSQEGIAAPQRCAAARPAALARHCSRQAPPQREALQRCGGLVWFGTDRPTRHRSYTQ